MHLPLQYRHIYLDTLNCVLNWDLTRNRTDSKDQLIIDPNHPYSGYSTEHPQYVKSKFYEQREERTQA